MKNILIGLLFAMLWASASVATKFGILSAPPLILGNLRFFIAGVVLLGYCYFISRDKQYRWPTASEWKQLAIFGFLNTTVYLGMYVIAMKHTAAGIGSLATSTNPLLIVLLSSWIMGRKAAKSEIISIIIGMSGIALATYPLLKSSDTTLSGVTILMLSMVAVSFASVYYAQIKWTLPNLLINGWQVTLGGLFLIPFTLVMSDFSAVQWDSRLIYSVLWLSLAVSVVGLICWFYLLKIDTVKASLWLFLCPLFGFFYAWWLLDEPITMYTVAGTFLVVTGLYIGQRKRLKS
ncbi:DMT family transporter [Pedobacter nyackensis]|uniref:Permease of the drug/metabolite transporter (DMT) superfamily n=1 Tax=Pedobacter nyackensis TaxID=475255 RepID=A0A1W1ZYN8_9SPHI|nr:DMT family transporter [Pedobacter nyackensis]SMC53565.1 Permease of the drug/metabolite transporter (DMT) superfamily [Pedobacter nyackensis]